MTKDDAAKVLKRAIEVEKIQIVFLVGCIVKVPLVAGVRIYNIHPADLDKFGGQGMYGLEVHKRVLRDIADLIKRGKKNIADRFFTYPTVHEVSEVYDQGHPLLRLEVEIPTRIIKEYLSMAIDTQEAAENLQQWVLPFEWLILPAAVNIAVRLEQSRLVEMEMEKKVYNFGFDLISHG